jgi:hypothetical protein
MEVGSNTSTVALRIVGGNKKGTQCLGVKLDHPIHKVNIYIYTGTWPFRLQES